MKMTKKYAVKKKRKIIFVCHANICRSPMALALAKRRLADKVEVSSAGVAAAGEHPPKEAVLVMKINYGLDIANHISRPVGLYRLSDYDRIIAMDYSIYRQLKEQWGVAESKLYCWDIEDPYGLDYEAYKEAAQKIEKRLEQLISDLKLDALD